MENLKTSQVQIVVLQASELQQIIQEAYIKGGEDMKRLMGVKQDRELSTTEAKALLGYTTHQYFREYIKRNRIKPCKTIRKVKYYKESDLLREGN